jgi:hypothetical protein
MRPLGSLRSLRLRRTLAWAAVACLCGAGRGAAQPSVTIPPPPSWTMLGLPQSVPALSRQRGAGAPCDTGATIAPDHVRAARAGVPAACLPNPAHETRAWCDLLDPGRAAPVFFRPEDWRITVDGPQGDYLRGPSQGPELLESSREILRSLERAETRESPGDSAMLARLAIVDTLLLREARVRGANVTTWLLTARLERLRGMRARTSDTSDGPGAESLQPALAAAGEALVTAPDAPDAHAWRAVLFDTRLPRFDDGRWVVTPLDRARALASLRRAIELAPADPRYAVLLARWLAEADDFDGAREALRACRAVDRRLVPILDDLCRLPRFRQLGFRTLDDYSLADWRWRLGDALRRLGREADHLEFRLRGWSWPDSAGAAEQALQQAWPGFRLFRVEDRKAASDARFYAQRVASPQADAAPATKRSSVAQDLEGGMSLVLLEHPAPAGGRACCTLVVVDWRTPD